MIKTSDYGRQTVDPKGFWITVGVVAAGFGLWGAYYLTTGKMPFTGLGLGRTLALTALNFCWALNVYTVSRKGWRALPWNHWVLQIGWSLFILGKYIYPHSIFSAGWIELPAWISMGVGALAPWISVSRKKPVEAAAEAGNR